MNPATPPPDTTADLPPKGFSHQAAKASWASGVLVFILIAFGARAMPSVMMDLIALGLMLVGLILGAISLFGIRKHGAKQILAPALVGILINGLLLSIFITNFLAARARAQRRTGALTTPVLYVSSTVADQSDGFRLST